MSRNIVVTIDADEYHAAVAKASERHRDSVLRGRFGYEHQSGVKSERRSWQHTLGDAVLGEIAEAALPRVLGLARLSRLGDVRGADLWDCVQVRATPYPHGNLLLHKEDPPEHAFVFAVVSDCRTVDFRGWCVAREVQVDDYWKDNMPHPCYVIPQEHLRGMDTCIARFRAKMAKLWSTGNA